jgi:hypothetical protein
MTPQSPAPDVAAATEHLTLGRSCEIERGEGEPATPAEMAAVEEWKRSPTAHYFELQWRKSGPTILEGQRIYKNVPPHSKRRLGSMTHAEVVRWHRALRGRPTLPVASREQSSARAPRRRSVRTRSGNRARAPSDPSDEPDPPLGAVPLARFRRDVRRWLEGLG